MRRFLFLWVFCLIPAFASAQQATQPPLNLINFETSATAEIPTDTLTMILAAEEHGLEPSELATKVNAKLEQALSQAKAQRGVRARSGNYQTTPIHDRGGQLTGWRVQGEIILESREFKTLGALAGKLQPMMKLTAMNFSLSRATREEAEARLLNEALTKFQTKAKQIAGTLGFPGFTLGQVHVRSDSPIRPPVPMRMQAMEAAAVGPFPPKAGRTRFRLSSLAP
jgi:predicted secreted protein